MSRFFSAVFFKCYALAKRTGNKEESDAIFTAVCAVSLLIFLNIFSIAIVLECWIFHTEVLATAIKFQIFIIIIIAISVYFLFMYNSRYQSLYLKYKKDILFSGRKGTWLTIVFTIFTFCFLASTIWLKCR